MIVSFQEFTTKLAHGQLKNTALVDDQDTGEINPAHEDQILTLTNQGLVDIFTKKKLREERAVLPLVSDQNVYTLDTSPAAPFEHMVRVIQVEGVRKEFPIEEKNKQVFLPKTNQHVTAPGEGMLRFSDTWLNQYHLEVDVVFQKLHPPITLTDNIDIPAHMYEALVLYVSGLYLSHMGGEAHTARGDRYYGFYLKMLSDDEIMNSSGTSEVVDEDTRFQDRGFV